MGVWTRRWVGMLERRRLLALITGVPPPPPSPALPPSGGKGVPHRWGWAPPGAGRVKARCALRPGPAPLPAADRRGRDVERPDRFRLGLQPRRTSSWGPPGPGSTTCVERPARRPARRRRPLRWLPRLPLSSAQWGERSRRPGLRGGRHAAQCSTRRRRVENQQDALRRDHPSAVAAQGGSRPKSAARLDAPEHGGPGAAGAQRSPPGRVRDALGP